MVQSELGITASMQITNAVHKAFTSFSNDNNRKIDVVNAKSLFMDWILPFYPLYTLYFHVK